METVSRLIRLLPRNNCLFVSCNQSVLITGRDGCVHPNKDEGLFVRESRLLSQYRYYMESEEFSPVALSNIEQESWLGYYIQLPPELKGKNQDADMAQHSLELLVHRFVGEGFHEDLQITNFNQITTSFPFAIEIEADFADIRELSNGRQQGGDLARTWRAVSDSWELRFDYKARHHYEHQGDVGDATMQRGLVIRIRNAGSEPTLVGSKVVFNVRLGPLQSWRTCIDFIPVEEGKLADQEQNQCVLKGEVSSFSKKREAFLKSSTAVEIPKSGSLSAVASAALERAKADLAALRRYDLDAGHGWMIAAGVPTYIALFGRDPLITGWQALSLTAEIACGAIGELAKWQTDKSDDWRDERPNGMLHQARLGPMSVLNYDPLARYYGSITTPAFYPIALAEYWRCTGDLSFAKTYLETAMRCLKWMEDQSRSEQNGFFQYKTRSEQGVKNQGWKDSSDAIVYADGSQVSDPIAPCEAQGYYYAAKEQLSQILSALDRSEEAAAFRRSADEFKKRFNEKFWMESDGLFALGLDGKGDLIKSVASNAAHCLGTGIADDSLAASTADRVFKSDMFSGWGMRTLSSEHPAYNPYSYHRGSVWPVEQGALVIGLRRFHQTDHMLQLCRALFELAGLFEFCRLPEVLSGHQRDDLHPFPALYPRANSPQAWSASAVYALITSLLGLFPWASLQVLIVDPQLPEWLPEITLRNLAIGQAVASIRFYRKPDGSSDYQILDVRGKLRILRRSDAWSLVRLPVDQLRDQLGA